MSGNLTHVLFENASGYALFEVTMQEEIAAKSKAVQEGVQDLSKFQKMVKLKSFLPFGSAAEALQNANDVSEGIISDQLNSLLQLLLPSAKSSTGKILLGVTERTLASSIAQQLGINCDTGERTLEMIRGIRQHAEHLLAKAGTGMTSGDVKAAQLGLGHSYSRSKVKFNVNRSDNMIIQAIALADQLDKDVNTFAMRIREWYSWHFPELVKIVPSNPGQYAKLVLLIGDKSQLTFNPEDKRYTEMVTGIQEICDDDETMAKNVMDAAKSSMGSDINEIDLINIKRFAERVVQLAGYRQSLRQYLIDKMHAVAPNLSALVGETIGARLISHAGSLTNLAKYPASTVQILGAEKALFRALKTKGNTPKYGLIYHSTFIGRAGAKHKGRISRFLANKCSIACRIDCFSDIPTNKYGEALRAQVEERLAFYETGAAVSKNSEAIAKAQAAIAASMDDDEDEDAEDAEDAKMEDVVEAVKLVEQGHKDVKAEADSAPAVDPELEKLKSLIPSAGTPKSDKKDKKEKSKKRKSVAGDVSAMEVDTPAAAEETTSKRSKKEKKSKSTDEAAPAGAVAAVQVAAMDVDTPSKKVKKEKKDKEEKSERKKKRKSEAGAA
ncbi:snoRNP complex protein nop56 [Naganishia vaughanmartiniae]|uniref:snoRNP complex protein nop56 n=1 Tax=Naganishia vaughanmartiniae TaxID=1424756 RepID=A0ACC2WUK1_9TREE|nr:snoRNP complex protein nop56 [Naganishia vaughanmartiniae]